MLIRDQIEYIYQLQIEKRSSEELESVKKVAKVAKTFELPEFLNFCTEGSFFIMGKNPLTKQKKDQI
ncbi:hypothetical protein BpHYR1_029890 [Brachionus plicatilis]|uniref:Uncharacterized protein n=1 Tax=Brachionus plicatilis TaxID=10195 RepID=A0A3M7QL34_BRAPC|nr:hypothetical protein BpHYR1_029890 [Brachionus plicatilis]